MTANEAQTRQSMNSMYRITRHVYDASRKYYLLGRDIMIAKLDAKAGQNVIEVGCGTARNLVKLAKLYPQAHFYGLDASDEMLKTAHKALARAELSGTVGLKQGFSQSFDPATMFGLSQAPDKIVFSYSLSIIPPWRESIDHALSLLPVGGEIHIVDFSGLTGLPAVFRAVVFWWLRLFHVYHKPEILAHLRALSTAGKGTINVSPLYRDYAYRAVFVKA